MASTRASRGALGPSRALSALSGLDPAPASWPDPWGGLTAAPPTSSSPGTSPDPFAPCTPGQGPWFHVKPSLPVLPGGRGPGLPGWAPSTRPVSRGTIRSAIDLGPRRRANGRGPGPPGPHLRASWEQGPLPRHSRSTGEALGAGRALGEHLEAEALAADPSLGGQTQSLQGCRRPPPVFLRVGTAPGPLPLPPPPSTLPLLAPDGPAPVAALRGPGTVRRTRLSRPAGRSPSIRLPRRPPGSGTGAPAPRPGPSPPWPAPRGRGCALPVPGSPSAGGWHPPG